MALLSYRKDYVILFRQCSCNNRKKIRWEWDSGWKSSCNAAALAVSIDSTRILIKYSRYQSSVSFLHEITSVAFHKDTAKTTQTTFLHVLKRISRIAYSSTISIWSGSADMQCTWKCYHTDLSTFRVSKTVILFKFCSSSITGREIICFKYRLTLVLC